MIMRTLHSTFGLSSERVICTQVHPFKHLHFRAHKRGGYFNKGDPPSDMHSPSQGVQRLGSRGNMEAFLMLSKPR